MPGRETPVDGVRQHEGWPMMSAASCLSSSALQENAQTVIWTLHRFADPFPQPSLLPGPVMQRGGIFEGRTKVRCHADDERRCLLVLFSPVHAALSERNQLQAGSSFFNCFLH